jgi:hypothetical protein
LQQKFGKPPVIPVSRVPIFKLENLLVSASRVPTLVIPVFHIIFHINLIKKSFRQRLPAGITDKSPAGITNKSPGPPLAGNTDKSPRQVQLLKIIKTGITETGITGVHSKILLLNFSSWGECGHNLVQILSKIISKSVVSIQTLKLVPKTGKSQMEKKL